MQLQRIRILVFVTFAVAASGEPARAQFGGLQRTLFRGAVYTGNHNFLSSPQNGPLFDNNIFDQRVEFNRAGQGWTYEQFHFFGTDSFNNPNTLDLGPFKIQLGSDPNVLSTSQPVGMHNRVGYTTTLIPEVFFESQTGQRAFDQFSGQTAFIPVPINYTVTFDAGVQSFEWTGNVLVNTEGTVNALGFYDLQMRVMNIGSYTADGFGVHDEQVTDFDTGPVNVSGHILMDAFAGLAQGLGNPDEAVTPRVVSAATSSRGKTVDELLASLEAGERVSDEDMSFLMTQMFQAAFLNDPLGFMQNGLPTSVPGFEALTVELAEEQPDASAAETPANVPEPGTLLLVAGILGLWWLLEPRMERRPSF
ncbi:MAG TPA: hypothetical protein VJZ71_19285 [Phycisphaerae bacterium]|nr:hypothetical protein [Phycisphaerae bacterium]